MAYFLADLYKTNCNYECKSSIIKWVLDVTHSKVVGRYDDIDDLSGADWEGHAVAQEEVEKENEREE